MTLTPCRTVDWFFDSGASNHMTSNVGNLLHSLVPSSPSSIVVGNGSVIPVTLTGSTLIPGSFRLDNVPVTLHLIKNLISV